MLYWDTLLQPIRIRKLSSEEKTSNDYRSEFKKDFDTVCNSCILRRLQDKAQVFPLEMEDYARTRLTHSIEVLSIAESLGIALQKEIRKKKNSVYLHSDSITLDNTKQKIGNSINDIPIILMTASLLHDMGNPPFGHLSEQIISDWFNENMCHIEKNGSVFELSENARNTLKDRLAGQYYQDLIHFDGNAQLLRLVTKLNYVVDDKGMNLTYPVMATFIKYPCSSDKINPNFLSSKKAGFFASENSVFENIANSLGLRDGEMYLRHPLTYLLEAADDIAYLTADMEDAHHKRILSLEEIQVYLLTYLENTELGKDVERALSNYKDTSKRQGVPDKEDYVIHRLRIFIKGYLISAVSKAISDNYELMMTGKCNKELLDLSDASLLVEALRDIEKDRVYYCREIIKSKTMATVIIKKLLDTYVLRILNYDKEKDQSKDTKNNLIYESFSPNYRFICELNNKQTDNEVKIIYNKLRLVIDQITGMTDSRALSIYKMITATL